ncbi:hypothetical protein [Sulfitobacter sp. M13]
MGYDKVAAPFFDLLHDEMQIGGYTRETWRPILEEFGGGIWENWQVGRDFEDASLYARFGVTHRDIPVSERRAFLESLVTRIEEFYGRSDLERIGGPGNEVSKITRLARARWNLDNLEGDIDPVSLAILGGLSEGRIRNMMTGADRIFENTGGKVSARSAAQWLANRESYYASIWEQEEDAELVEPNADMSDAVFVPRASDGSVFHPGLARNGHFTIGAKGHERQVEDFDEVLRQLLNMRGPRWRRPNAAGDWGIVKENDLIRIERADLMNGKLPC